MANVFYRAGYIENWGHGIQKICDACDETGAERPVYQVVGRGIRVFFKGLECALFDHENGIHAGTNAGTNGTDYTPDVVLETEKDVVLEAPADQNDVLEAEDDLLHRKVYQAICEDNRITITQIAKKLGVAPRTVDRIISHLRENKFIVRINGKRYGYWEVAYSDLPL